MKDIKKVSSAELHQWLANAFVTACQALGHGKTASNQQQVEMYRRELNDRGERLPSLGLFEESAFKQSLYGRGVFNGPGSV
jgi:hypothetical protein